MLGAIPPRPHTNCLINHKDDSTLSSLFFRFSDWNFIWLYGNDNINGVLIEGWGHAVA
jgi:hypothetical protein